MRQKIIDLYNSNPRTYICAIKKDAELTQWVLENAIGTSNSFPALVYSAVHQIPLQCKHNNTRKFSRWGTGLTGCGPAALCKCTQQQISQHVSATKQQQCHDSANSKRAATMIAKYGVAHNLQRLDVKQRLRAPKISTHAHNKLTSKSWLNTEYNTRRRSAVDIAAEVGVDYSTVLSYCRQHCFDIRANSNYSLVEVEIANYICSLGFGVEQHNRTLLQGQQEIDLYVPCKKLAIEVNGLYWHSNNNPHKHSNKSTYAEQQGIKLLHITDRDWREQPAAVKNIIARELGVLQSSSATHAEPISADTAYEFLQRHSLVNTLGSINAGLFADTQLIGVATAEPSRFSRSSLTILDVASAADNSKLLFECLLSAAKHAIATCSRDSGDSALLAANNFELVGLCSSRYCTDGTSAGRGDRTYWTSGNWIFEWTAGKL